MFSRVAPWIRSRPIRGPPRFDDGSRVTISGKSSLAVSAHLRKELHLWDGALSADIAPQSELADADSHSDGGPRSLGTQLNVDVGASSTLLNVNEGRWADPAG
ncbi:MAG: hypothetical protein Ct9H300mP1_34680 [Planctomycetaceae bacterium]|nr:MAG: hypothetical protein Ct9H300mP1_34680 [Planctomycetaceae bacterium]